MSRSKKKIQPGDIFELKVSDSKFVCLQFISDDPEMLGGDLVRFFKKTSSSPLSEDTIEEIINSGVHLYGFTYLGTGIKHKLYRYIANRNNISLAEVDKLTFHSFTDSDLVNGELTSRYSIRKAGQGFREATTNKENYDRLKESAWEDEVMFAEGFIALFKRQNI